jgi:hypothetical protein
MVRLTPFSISFGSYQFLGGRRGGGGCSGFFRFFWFFWFFWFCGFFGFRFGAGFEVLSSGGGVRSYAFGLFASTPGTGGRVFGWTAQAELDFALDSRFVTS